MTGKEFFDRIKKMKDGDAAYITIIKKDGIFYCQGEELDING